MVRQTTICLATWILLPRGHPQCMFPAPLSPAIRKRSVLHSRRLVDRTSRQTTSAMFYGRVTVGRILTPCRRLVGVPGHAVKLEKAAIVIWSDMLVVVGGRSNKGDTVLISKITLGKHGRSHGREWQTTGCWLQWLGRNELIQFEGIWKMA